MKNKELTIEQYVNYVSKNREPIILLPTIFEKRCTIEAPQIACTVEYMSYKSPYEYISFKQKLARELEQMKQSLQYGQIEETKVLCQIVLVTISLINELFVGMIEKIILLLYL